MKRLTILGTVIAGLLSIGVGAPAAQLVASMLNPVVTQRTIRTTICSTRWVKQQRDVSRQTKNKVFVAARIPKAEQRKYAIDHVVPIQLGGSDRLTNLVAQPLAESKQKDAIEDVLKAEVCTQRILLLTAQRTISADWRNAVRPAVNGFVGETPPGTTGANPSSTTPTPTLAPPPAVPPTTQIGTVPGTTATPPTVQEATTCVTTAPTTNAAPIPPPATVAAPRRYSNCSELNAEYPHGVGRSGAVDKTSGTPPVTSFHIDDALYNAQPRTLDRDNDGIASEQA
jgi:Excalibur calcium-binding domain